MALFVEQQSPLIAVSTAGESGRDGTNGMNGTDGTPGANGFGAVLRPGDRPQAFTSVVLGAATAAPALDPAGIVADAAHGPTYDLSAPGIVALRDPIWLEPDAFFAVRVVLFRRAEPVTFECAGVRVGIQWLDAAYADLGQVPLRTWQPLRVADGLQCLTQRVPSLLGDAPVDVVPPAAAVFWRPFVQSAVEIGAVSILSMTIADVTNTGVYAPDLSRLVARVRALESIVGASTR